MIALQEQEIESSAWLSAEAREALPFLSPLDEHDEQRPTFAHDDHVFDVLGPDDTTWEDTDAEEAPLEDEPAPEMVLDQHVWHTRLLAVESVGSEDEVLVCRIRRRLPPVFQQAHDERM